MSEPPILLERMTRVEEQQKAQLVRLIRIETLLDRVIWLIVSFVVVAGLAFLFTGARDGDPRAIQSPAQPEIAAPHLVSVHTIE